MSFINNSDSDTLITGTADSDTIINSGNNVTINALEGDDTISNTADNVTITGGEGNDTITNSGENIVYIYNKGDGNDVINGFTESDTFIVNNGAYSITSSGDDVIVSVGDGYVTLKNAANLDDLNIMGNYDTLAATFVYALQQKTEAGYPIIAGLFFHPEEYHGFETLSSSFYEESETLTISSSDGLELTAYHYTPETPNDKWVILVHGYGHNHRHMNGFAMQYLQNNYQVLMVDQRAAGDSEGEWLTMGAAEGEDVALWTHKIAELNPNAKIVLHGVSMGAATAMLAAANPNLTNVTSLIEDCGYTQVIALVDIAKSFMTELQDPEFINWVSETSGILTGHKLTEAAPIDSIGSATMPSMFITGTADQVISPSMLDSLYTASGAEVKEIFTVEGATHGVSALTDSIGYGNAVFRFNAEAAGEGWVTSNVTNNISLRGTKYDDTITSSGKYVTITGGAGDDTITNSGSNNVYIYNSGDGNDVIVGFATNDTLTVDGAEYQVIISGSDKLVSIAGSENFITLKDSASITPKIAGTPFQRDRAGQEVVNPVAMIASGDATYYYESVARATNDADNNSTVTVIADSTETSTINTSKGLTIQFAESGLGVYSVTGGNFVSADNSTDAQFSVDSNRVTSNSNTLQLRNGATATLDGYEVTRISNRYSVIGNSFDNNISNSGERVTINAAEGNDSISNTGNNVSVTGGAGNDEIINVGDNVSIEGNDGDDYILSGGNNSSINAGAGNDTLLVTEDIATNELIEIEGGEGNDSIFAASIENNGELEIDGDEGNDIITVTHVSNKGLLEIDGDDGDDIISVTNIMDNSGKIDIEGDTGNDSIIIASLAADISINISGDAGNDSITLTANAPAAKSSKAYTVNGGEGNDTITSDGADVIYQYDSGDGNDVIIGFTDSDTLLIDGTQYRARTINEDFIVNVAEDANAIAAKDKATFIIADSKVVSVDGFAAISGLNNATVHATGNVTVNGANVQVTGDNDFNVIVSDTKTTGLANISAGASVEVANVNVTTDNNGEFKVGENLYTINDADNSVTFITGSNGAVENVTNFSGSLNTNSRNVTINGAALNTNDTDVTISSAGAGISQINGVGSGDVLSGDIDSARVSVTVTSADDTALWSLNNRTYTLTGDADGVLITGNRIDGLDNAASLEVGAAATYLVNNTPLDAKIGDTIIGTAEGSAYIFDPNNVPLDVSSMTDDEISAQVGISTEFATSETDTEKSAALINDASKLNGNMELALSNSDTTTAQTADFTNSTGKKKVTLTEGAQDIKFNDEGGNVAVIESDSAGEKNVTLGGGGDLVIVKDTKTPVNITGGTGKDTIVTAGNNVTVDLKGGATKIVPNGGNINLTNYDALTGAGIQIDEVSDIERAVQNGNINFGNGVVSLGSATVNLGSSESESTTVNLYDNQGRKQKVAYTHSDGGTIDTTNARENILLVGNNNSTKSNGSSLKSGAGNDMAFGGAGDYFDLGAGNNRVYLNSNRSSGSSGATVAMTATEGTTEVNGFNSGFDDNGDKLSINISSANVSFEGGKLSFNFGNASLILNFTGSSADLIEDNNFISESADLGEISPVTYEQGDYQNIYENPPDTISSGTQITFAKA